jgi:hypothetical protein
MLHKKGVSAFVAWAACLPRYHVFSGKQTATASEARSNATTAKGRSSVTLELVSNVAFVYGKDHNVAGELLALQRMIDSSYFSYLFLRSVGACLQRCIFQNELRTWKGPARLGGAVPVHVCFRLTSRYHTAVSSWHSAFSFADR